MNLREFSDRAFWNCDEPRSDFRTETAEEVGTEPCWNVFSAILFDETYNSIVLVEVDDDN